MKFPNPRKTPLVDQRGLPIYERDIVIFDVPKCKVKDQVGQVWWRYKCTLMVGSYPAIMASNIRIKTPNPFVKRRHKHG